MANFYYEKYVNNYEIDFHNYGTKEEKEFLSKLYHFSWDVIGVYYKDGDEWCKRQSGMTFDIKNLSYYPELKKYLDYRFKIFERSKKLEKIKKD